MKVIETLIPYRDMVLLVLRIGKTFFPRLRVKNTPMRLNFLTNQKAMGLLFSKFAATQKNHALNEMNYKTKGNLLGIWKPSDSI